MLLVLCILSALDQQEIHQSQAMTYWYTAGGISICVSGTWKANSLKAAMYMILRKNLGLFEGADVDSITG